MHLCMRGCRYVCTHARIKHACTYAFVYVHVRRWVYAGHQMSDVFTEQTNLHTNTQSPNVPFGPQSGAAG